MTNRRSFLVASAVVAAASATVTAAADAAPGSPEFDRAAFESLVRAPFRHRQAFATPRVAGGAVLGFMFNSLNAYERGFGEGPGTLHAAAVLYSSGVALALDDAAWQSFHLADLTQRSGDHVTADAAGGNPFVHAPKGWTIPELLHRNVSFFVCSNALADLARRAGTTPEVLQSHLLPGMMMVPAGVAAINALQEEHFTLFQAGV